METQPVAVGFSSEEVETIRKAWQLLDEKDSITQPERMIGAFKAKLKERVLDVVWCELSDLDRKGREVSRQRLHFVLRDIIARFAPSAKPN